MDFEKEISRAEMIEIWRRVGSADLTALPDMAYWHRRYPSLNAEFDRYMDAKDAKRANPGIAQPAPLSKNRKRKKASKSGRQEDRSGPVAPPDVRPPHPATISSALAGTGFTVIKLHRLWARARRGQKNAIGELDGLLAMHPRLHIAVDAFQRGHFAQASATVKQPEKRGELRVNGLVKLAVSATNPRPLSGGLPSLGKKR